MTFAVILRRVRRCFLLGYESLMDASSATQLAAEAKSRFQQLLLEPWKRMLRRRGVPTLQYLLKTEAHTYAFP